MDTTWMDEQFVLDFYQACLTLLFWLLATFAGLAVLATAVFLWLECIHSKRPRDRCLKEPRAIGTRA